MKKIKFAIFALVSSLLVACAQQDHHIYYWGNYSDVIYSYYNEPGDFGKQEAALREIIAKSKEKGKPVAPGVYGHLGLVLLKQGKNAEAQAALQEEQRLYPESTQFMQYLQRKK